MLQRGPPANEANAVSKQKLDNCTTAPWTNTVPRMALPFPQLPVWLLLAAGALWSLLFLQVHSVWTSAPQYNYGWAVPLLALYLFWNRWESRPAPSASPAPTLCLGLAAALLLTLLPVSIIHEANHDWRLLNWAFALAVAGLTWLAMAWAGGRAWLRHFAFPVAFPLLAVPWPTIIEDPLVLSLMHVVSFVAVEGLNLCHVPAIQRGNVIEIGPGMVGVDEACSGIQSFQSALMVSLFLGELFQFTRSRRFGLIGGAVLWAFLCNLARAFFLAWISHREGLRALDRWHDHTGLALMLACYGGIIALALALSRRQGVATPAPAAEPAPPAASAPLSASPPSAIPPARVIPRPVLLGVLAWLALVQLATEAWYRRHERGVAPQPAWSVTWPQQMPQFKTEDFSDPVRRMLLYNEAEGASWQDPDGNHWLAYFFRWHPGNSRAKTTQVHNPEVCLPSGGMTKIAAHGRREYPVGTLQIPFETFTFRDQHHIAHVFYCVWQNKISAAATTANTSSAGTPDGAEHAPMGNWKTRDRLRNVLRGERHFGQQVLEVIIFDAPDFAQAEAALLRRLPDLIKPR